MTEEIVVDAEERRSPRSWDFFLTVFLILMVLVLTAIFIVLGLGMSVATIACGDSALSCNGLAISIGTLLVIVGTPLVALAGIITSVVFIARRRVSFVVPLVTGIVLVGVYMLGAWLVAQAVP
nr:hypothetical protein WG33_0150 [uncultured bacterium]